MVSSFPENRQYFCQYVNTQPHTINIIVNTADIDNNIDRVRSAIRMLIVMDSVRSFRNPDRNDIFIFILALDRISLYVLHHENQRRHIFR